MANDAIPTAIEVEINHIDYEAFNDLYDGDIVDNSGCSLANALFICLRIQIAVYARLLAQQKELVEKSTEGIDTPYLAPRPRTSPPIQKRA
jgi:hypothetical protein